jgi:hypothetical protein
MSDRPGSAPLSLSLFAGHGDIYVAANNRVNRAGAHRSTATAVTRW